MWNSYANRLRYHGALFIKRVITRFINVVKLYKNALTWRHENDALKKRVSEKVLKAYDAIGEKYYDNSLAENDNWKDRESKKNYASWAIPYYEKAGNRPRVTLMQLIIKDLDAKIKEDNKKFGKPLKDFPEASGFCNKLIKAGYTTLGDFLKASESKIDEIPKPLSKSDQKDLWSKYALSTSTEVIEEERQRSKESIRDVLSRTQAAPPAGAVIIKFDAQGNRIE